MAASYDEIAVEAFLDAIRAQRDADEFERLIVGDELSFEECMARIETGTDLLYADDLVWRDDLSALEQLKADRALASLRERYPDVWQQATCDA